MDGWSKKIEDKLLEMRMHEYEASQKNQKTNNLIKIKIKPFVFALGLSFVILSILETILLFVGIFSSLTAKDSSIGLLWNYSFDSVTIGETTYKLSSFGTAIIIIAVLLIANLAIFAFYWTRDDFYQSLDKKNKRLWLTTLIASESAFIVFIILILFVITILQTNNLFPSNLYYAKNGDSLGLCYVIFDKVGGLTIDFTLQPSAFAIFVSVMHLLTSLASIIWLIAFSCSVNLKRLFGSKKSS